MEYLRKEAPWMAGIRAAKANLLPALLVQGAMAVVVACYFTYPPTTQWLDYLANLKMAWGYGFSAFASAIAGALFPELVKIIFR